MLRNRFSPSRRHLLRLGVAALSLPLLPALRAAAEDKPRKKFVFVASPIRNKADGQKLREALRPVEEIREFQIGSGKRPNTANVTIVAELAEPGPLVEAAEKAGFQLKLVTSDDAGGGDGGNPTPPGEQPAEAATLKFTARNVRNDQDGAKLRDALLAVEGVTGVSMKSTKTRGTANVDVETKGATASALISAAKDAGFTLKAR